MPRGKEYLVTALSVFFSFGAVLAALVAIIFIPKNSCDPLPAPCDLDRNLGWKYELVALGLIVCAILSSMWLRLLIKYTKTFGMFLGRIVFFRLHESPRYLVHAGRKQDALESLQMISKFNGSELELDLEDVEDHIRVPPSRLDLAFPTENGLPSSRLFDADLETSSSPTEIKGPSTLTHACTPLSSTPPDGTEGTPLTRDYSATGGSEAPLAAYAGASAASERRSFPYHSTPVTDRTFHNVPPSPKEEEVLTATEDTYSMPRPRLRSPSRWSRVAARHPRRDTISSVRSSLYEVADRAYWALPRSMRRPVRAWLSRFKMVLEPEWRRTTLLVWVTWWGIMLAFTMFNVYLPKLLETRRVMSFAKAGSLERTLWDVVIFTIGGCPGAVVRLIFPLKSGLFSC
jgi:hypothetical protein